METDAGLEILRYDDTSALGHQSRRLGAFLAHGLLCGCASVFGELFSFISGLKLKIRRENFRLWSTEYFDLLASACCRIPEWRTSTFSSDRFDIVHLNNYITTTFARSCFTEQFNECMSHLSQRNQRSMAKRIMTSLCAEGRTMHFEPSILTKCLNIIQPQDLTDTIPLLPFGSLAVCLFSYTESMFQNWPQTLDVEIPRRFLDLLLKKYCSKGICLSSPQIIIPYKRKNISGIYQWPVMGLRPACLRLGISHQRENSQFVTVIRASIMQAFFSEGDLMRKHVQGFPQLSTQETEFHSPQIIMIFELILDDNQNISNIFSKPIRSYDPIKHIIGLPRILQRSAREYSNSSPKESFRQDYHDKSQSNVKNISLGDFYDNLEQPKLDVTQTIAFLVKAGYLQPEALDHADPFKVLVNEEIQYTKRTDRNTIDWFFSPHFELFSNAFSAAIQAEKEVGNLMAIAPCHGGMLATELWYPRDPTAGSASCALTQTFGRGVRVRI